MKGLRNSGIPEFRWYNMYGFSSADEELSGINGVADAVNAFVRCIEVCVAAKYRVMKQASPAAGLDHLISTLYFGHKFFL